MHVRSRRAYHLSREKIDSRVTAKGENKKIIETNYPNDKDFSLEKVFEQIKSEPELLRLFGAEW